MTNLDKMAGCILGHLTEMASQVDVIVWLKKNPCKYTYHFSVEFDECRWTGNAHIGFDELAILNDDDLPLLASRLWGDCCQSSAILRPRVDALPSLPLCVNGHHFRASSVQASLYGPQVDYHIKTREPVPAHWFWASLGRSVNASINGKPLAQCSLFGIDPYGFRLNAADAGITPVLLPQPQLP